jgi:SAM-dependent methyltransferase
MSNSESYVDRYEPTLQNPGKGSWRTEVSAGQRFEFGKNWQRFLEAVDEDRIAAAQSSMLEMLESRDLIGRSFLDIGCGSGLSSLAALRAGCREIISFDFDPDSVASTKTLRERYESGGQNWIVSEGSVLDPGFLATLGTFDVVYSWGVLHHTGNMWAALENLCPLVRRGGKLFIAIYNDEAEISGLWRRVKSFYNRGWASRFTVFSLFFIWQLARGLAVDLLIKWRSPLARYRNYKTMRGMSFSRDIADWLGGFPYEVAKPEQIFEFYTQRGFTLTKLKTVGRGHGNNEFVFTKREKPSLG